MNTQQMEDRQKRVACFLQTETGKAFFKYKAAIVRVRDTRNDDDDTQSGDHYQALQEMMDAEDRLMELAEGSS